MPQSLTEIRTLLAAHDLHPKHRFGQNFLHDATKIERICELADLHPGETILEVGPGTGTLSLAMLERSIHLIAVEIDADLEPILREQLAPFADRANLLITDILDGKHTINPTVVAALNNQPFKLVANLPYNVASPLLANLVADHPTFTAGLVMIQREVADRLTAPPGGKDFGPLGILIQSICHVKRVMTLPPGCFWPTPKVDSAVVQLIRRDTPLTNNPAQLAAMLHRLFSKRRKQIGSILGRATQLPDGIDPTARPEQLTVEQLIKLAESVPASKST